MYKNLLLLLGLLFFTACSPKIAIQTVKPASIERATHTKKIFVDEFLNDYDGFTSKLQSRLSSKIVNGNNFFTVIDEKNLDTSSFGKKVEYIGIANKNNKRDLNNLIKPEAIISGVITDASDYRRYYRESRFECLDKKCKDKREFFIKCVEVTYHFSVDMKMIDTFQGDIIYADSFSTSTVYNQCRDRNNYLPFFKDEIDYLSYGIIDEFIAQISPTIAIYNVELLDEPEITYDDNQKELLKISLEYIEKGYIQKAEELLTKLIESTQNKDFVSIYNLAVLKEYNKDYQNALDLYKLAESLTIKPNELITKAIMRINVQIHDKRKVEKQIKN